MAAARAAAERAVKNLWDKVSRPEGVPAEDYQTLHERILRLVVERFCVDSQEEAAVATDVVEACLEAVLPGLYLRHLGVTSPTQEELFVAIEDVALGWRVGGPKAASGELASLGLSPATAAADDAVVDTLSPGADASNYRRNLTRLIRSRITDDQADFRIVTAYVDHLSNYGQVPSSDRVAETLEYPPNYNRTELAAAIARLRALAAEYLPK